MPKKWTPRGSAIGNYFACSMRAMLDRLMYEQPEIFAPEDLSVVEGRKASSPYADLGTVIHYHAQTKLKAEFSAGAHEPTAEQLANAAQVFKGNESARDMAISKASDALARIIGPDPDGRRWIAEPSLKRPWITGHIDLLSSDGTELVDIKTTSKPPYYTHLPPTHVLQTLAYVQALSETGIHVKRVRIVSIASQSVDWYMDSPYDPTTEAMMQLRSDLVAFATRLRSKKLFEPGNAVPNIGDACENWCPYTHMCRDRYAVAKGDKKPVDAPVAPIKKANPFGALMPVGSPGRTLGNHKE